MATAERVVKNTIYLYVRIGVNIVVSLYTTRLILLSLGAVDFGIYNIVGGAIAMLGFLNGAMAMGTQRFMNYAEGEGDFSKKERIFNTSCIMHIILSLIVGIILCILSLFFFNGLLDIPIERITASKVVYGSLVISTVFTIMTVPYDAVINSHENMLYYSIVGILESILKLIVAFLCAHSRMDKLIVYGILMAMIPIASLIVMRIYCHQKYPECRMNLRTKWDKKLAYDMTSFAGWNFICSISAIVSQYGLGIILNNFFGVLLNTAQGIANQVSSVLMSFSNNALRAINPIIVKSEGERNKDKMLYSTLLACRITFYIFGIFALPIIMLAPYILKLWLKDVPEWAVIFCQLQIIRIWIELLTFSTYQAISAKGEIKAYSIVKTITNALPLVFVPIAFYLGAQPYYLYIIWTICWSILGGIVSVVYAHKIAGLSYDAYSKSVLIPGGVIAILSFTPYVVLNSLMSSTLYSHIICTILGIITFALGEWKYSLEENERRHLINIFTSKFFKR